MSYLAVKSVTGIVSMNVCRFLVPGGTLSQEGDGPHKTDACVFNAPDEIDVEIMKKWETVFLKLIRRYKYLEKLFQVSLSALRTIK